MAEHLLCARRTPRAIHTISGVFVLLLLLQAASGAARTGPAVAADAPTVVIERFGRYASGGTVETRPAPDSSGGVALVSTDRRHLEWTYRIPARIGETWGVEYRLRNPSETHAVRVRRVVDHPPIEQPDGSVLDSSATGELVIPPKGEIQGAEVWSFFEGYEYELVPGTWRMQLFADEIRLLDFAFSVEGPVERTPTPTEPRPMALGVRHEQAATSDCAFAGTRVTGVFPDTPASRLGLMPNDEIIAIDGVAVATPEDLRAMLDLRDGQKVVVRIRRGDAQREGSVELEAREPPEPARAAGLAYRTLHDAVLNGSLDSTLALLVNGGDPNQPNAKGWTPLHRAAFTGETLILRALLAAGGDPDRTNLHHRRPLHAAVEGGHLLAARALLRAGADPDGGDEQKTTALHLAAVGGHVEMAKLLIESGATVSAPKSSGWAPIHDAVLNGRVEMIRFLLARGADANSRSYAPGVPLIFAAERGDLDSVRALVEDGGARTDLATPEGWLPIDAARDQRHRAVVDYLSTREK